VKHQLRVRPLDTTQFIKLDQLHVAGSDGDEASLCHEDGFGLGRYGIAVDSDRFADQRPVVSLPIAASSVSLVENENEPFHGNAL